METNMSKPINKEAINANLARSRRNDAQRLYNALNAGWEGVNVRAICNGNDGRFFITGEVNGAYTSFPVDEDAAWEASRALAGAKSRQRLANVALDAANPEGKAHRVKNGYPGLKNIY